MRIQVKEPCPTEKGITYHTEIEVEDGLEYCVNPDCEFYGQVVGFVDPLETPDHIEAGWKESRWTK